MNPSRSLASLNAYTLRGVRYLRLEDISTHEVETVSISPFSPISCSQGRLGIVLNLSIRYRDVPDFPE